MGPNTNEPPLTACVPRPVGDDPPAGIRHEIRTLLAAVASPNGNDPVLAAAARLAGKIGAKLHAVHVLELPPAVEPALEFGYLGNEARGAPARRLCERLERRWGGGRATPGLTWHAVRGTPGPAVAEVARKVGADLVVAGATRRTRPLRKLLGTTAGKIVRSSETPILVLESEIERPISRVLMTTDLAEDSGRVYERCAAVLEAILQPRDRPEVRCILSLWFGDSAQPREGRKDELTLADLDRFLNDHAGRSLHVSGAVLSGQPSEAIPAEARRWGAELLVMGTHSRRGLERILLGSVAEAVLRDAPCNVLVVPGAAVPHMHRYPAGPSYPRCEKRSRPDTEVV